jgi:hypothetical protein
MGVVCSAWSRMTQPPGHCSGRSWTPNTVMPLSGGSRLRALPTSVHSERRSCLGHQDNRPPSIDSQLDHRSEHASNRRKSDLRPVAGCACRRAVRARRDPARRRATLRCTNRRARRRPARPPHAAARRDGPQFGVRERQQTRRALRRIAMCAEAGREDLRRCGEWSGAFGLVGLRDRINLSAPERRARREEGRGGRSTLVPPRVLWHDSSSAAPSLSPRRLHGRSVLARHRGFDPAVPRIQGLCDCLPGRGANKAHRASRGWRSGWGRRHHREDSCSGASTDW